jgi:hypothetical protein
VIGGRLRHMSPVSPPSSSATPDDPKPANVQKKRPKTMEQANLGTSNRDRRSATQQVQKTEPKASDWISSLPGSLSPVTPPDSPAAVASTPVKLESSGPARPATNGAKAATGQPPPPPTEDCSLISPLRCATTDFPHLLYEYC